MQKYTSNIRYVKCLNFFVLTVSSVLFLAYSTFRHKMLIQKMCAEFGEPGPVFILYWIDTNICSIAQHYVC